MEEAKKSIESPSPNRRNREKGFFKKVRSLRRNNNKNELSPGSPKKISSPGGRRLGRGRFSKKSQGMEAMEGGGAGAVSTVIPEDSVVQPRRVIKVARPIPSQPYNPTTPTSSTMKSMIPSSDHETVDTNSSSSVGERIQIRGGSNDVSPSIQNENLREKTEEWRRERLDATAAIRKENKEKDIMQHRRNSVKKDAAQADDGTKAKANVPDEIEVSEIFKTRTFHPEHKRKVEAEDRSEKKLKVDERTDEVTNVSVVEESKDEKKQEIVKQSNQMPSWMIVAPATVVAACAVAFVLMKSMRKR